MNESRAVAELDSLRTTLAASGISGPEALELAAVWMVIEGRARDRAEVMSMVAQREASAERARREAAALQIARHDYTYLKRWEPTLPEDETHPRFRVLLARARSAQGLPPQDAQEHAATPVSPVSKENNV